MWYKEVVKYIKPKNLKIKTKRDLMSTAIQTLKRNAYGFAALLFLGAAMAPAILAPRFASAAQVTERSIEMSSSQKSATGVSYKINFTIPSTYSIKGLVIDFSPVSPIPGQANPTLPTSMVLGNTVSAISGLTGAPANWTVTATDTTAIRVTNAAGGSVTAGPVSLTVSGFTNPNLAEPNNTFYARIFTYTSDTAPNSYTSTVPGAVTDSGGVALAVTNSVDVKATVQESLKFCVSKTAPHFNCGGGIATPEVILGTGSPAVLDEANIYTGDAWFQMSTNAGIGAKVNMKGANGTLTSGANTIAAKGAMSLMSAGIEAFGLKVANGIDPTLGTPTPTSGTLTAAPYYATATPNWYALNSTNISSAFGDTIASATGPIQNKNSQITFAATASAVTKPGVYTGAYSLIAIPSY